MDNYRVDNTNFPVMEKEVKMKKLILIPILFLLTLGIVSATDIFTEPYNEIFTPESETGKSIATVKSELNIKSCYVKENWESKQCNYLYYCVMISPSDSSSVNDALWKECEEVTEDTSVEIVVKDFLPPKGVLYYVTSFFTKVTHTCNLDSCSSTEWESSAEIPEAYINAHDIRSVCPEGQMLAPPRDAGGVITGLPKCYISQRVCIDNLNTGVCTNAYPLYVLDLNEDGIITSAEVDDATNYCKDANSDRICDLTVDLECVDLCSDYDLDVDGNMVCVSLGPNSKCDEWDMASEFGCIDDELSPNSNICDDVDVEGCLRNYDPVCVATTSGTTIGGVTYPNSCFAEKGQGYYECPTATPETNCYVIGSCQPPVTQCYVAEDCPDTNVCLGGSTAGITKMCLGNMCSYSGACGNLACDVDSDCDGMNLPCVGVFAHCDNGICAIGGKCMEAPQPTKFSIWDLIINIFTAFFNFVKSLFGA